MRKPPFTYVGAKTKLLDLILREFPPHDTYTEPFGGSGVVLLNKAPAKLEVFNDLDDAVVNFFEVVRDRVDDFKKVLDLTPYSRGEHDRCVRKINKCDGLEKARAFYMGIQSSFNGRFGNTFSVSANPNKNPARKFRTYRDRLHAVAERLRHVVFENCDGLDVIQMYDRPTTLHYLDPTYLKDSLGKTDPYRFMMEDRQHVKLVEALLTVKGKVILSGFEDDNYARLYAPLKEWRRLVLDHWTMNNKQRKSHRAEALWMNF